MTNKVAENEKDNTNNKVKGRKERKKIEKTQKKKKTNKNREGAYLSPDKIPSTPNPPNACDRRGEGSEGGSITRVGSSSKQRS